MAVVVVAKIRISNGGHVLGLHLPIPLPFRYLEVVALAICAC